MLAKIYGWLLWFVGEPLTDEELEECKGGGDRWTYHERRSMKRLEKWWYLKWAVILTIHLIVLIDNLKKKRWIKFGLGIAVTGFFVWFLPHVMFGCW